MAEGAARRRPLNVPIPLDSHPVRPYSARQSPNSERGGRANKTLRGVTGIHVVEQKAHVEKGKITEYRATIEVTFILEG